MKSTKSKGRNKGIETKELILDRSMSLFLEKGYSATSTSQICTAVGINKQSLYYHIKSKKNLFYSCHMRSIDQRLKPFLDRASAIADPEERLGFMIRDFTTIVCKNPELKVLIHETITMTDRYFKKIRDVWKEHYSLLKTTIAELQEKGSIPMDLRPSRAALFLLGMMSWIPFWFDYGKTQEAEDVAETALRFALNGLSYKKKTSAGKGSRSERLVEQIVTN